MCCSILHATSRCADAVVQVFDWPQSLIRFSRFQQVLGCFLSFDITASTVAVIITEHDCFLNGFWPGAFLISFGQEHITTP